MLNKAHTHTETPQPIPLEQNRAPLVLGKGTLESWKLPREYMGGKVVACTMVGWG